jgi:hypothetical protein
MEDNYIWEDDLDLTDMLNLLNQQNDIGFFYIGNANVDKSALIIKKFITNYR